MVGREERHGGRTLVERLHETALYALREIGGRGFSGDEHSSESSFGLDAVANLFSRRLDGTVKVSKV